MTYAEFYKAVDSNMIRLYGIGAVEFDERKVHYAYADLDTPMQTVQFLAEKYDLTPIPMLQSWPELPQEEFTLGFATVEEQQGAVETHAAKAKRWHASHNGR